MKNLIIQVDLSNDLAHTARSTLGFNDEVQRISGQKNATSLLTVTSKNDRDHLWHIHIIDQKRANVGENYSNRFDWSQKREENYLLCSFTLTNRAC